MNKKKFIDEFNNIHYLDEELGRGGQGVVYKTKDADTVIKIALRNCKPIIDQKEIKNFHQKVKKLIYKPMPLDINIAMPKTILQGEAAYVMSLLNGMVSFAKLFPSESPKEKMNKIYIPDFLKELNEKDKITAFYFAYYLDSGGLRKRLYTLSRVAIVLMRLHSRGLVYFDISHNNIFINNDDIPLVYLIDADNIEYEDFNNGGFYTPNYEVPEVQNNNPNSLYSDIYAFGILSYLTLTTTHPFDGKGNQEADWDSDNKEKKEQWELPWIEDSNDDSNKSTKGIRGSLTLTNELDTLFHKLFEDGKDNKYKRPTLPLWIESLEKAATKTIKCDSCNMSYYDDIFYVCPYCDSKKPQRIIAKSYYYKNNQKLSDKWYFVKEINNNTKQIKLPSYIFKSFDILKIYDIFLNISFNKKNRVELSFEKNNEEIYIDNKLMHNTRIPLNLNKFSNGISIRVIDNEDIETLIEIEIKE
jgi:serine/threonine protein kinase